MADISFDVAEGYYLSTFIARMILSANVKSLQYSVNAGPPAISKYIAYDQLTPPNPFIAVTQDGRGNVVYDGGFPKFYNAYTPPEGIKDSVSVEFNATCTGVTGLENGNCYYYNQFAADIVTIAIGDKLVYDVMTNHVNVRTGIDALTNAQPNSPDYSLRDWGVIYTDPNSPRGIKDQNGLASHPATDLSAVALNKWYHREFDLTPCAGKTFRKWTMAHEADVAGDFSARYRDVYIVDKTGKIKATLFKDVLKMPGNSNTEFGASGYTNLSKVVYDPRSQLTASFKYLYNAINWAANESKVVAGNRKILILGDQVSGGSYWVKGTDNNGFYYSLSRLCAAVGFTPTFKDSNDYAGGYLNPTLAELEQYSCVLIMSSRSGAVAWVTDAGADALVAYREAGSGVIMITDHGPVISDISGAYPPTTAGAFFWTANKVAVRFGTYFTGNYDRQPVNVGFLRSTYGDHALYSGMADTESINAGASESRVQVQEYPDVLPGNVPPFNIPFGRTIIQVVAILNDGSAVSYKITYNVVTFKISISDGTVVKDNGQTLDVGAKNQSLIQATMSGTLNDNGAGIVYKNDVRVGTVSYTPAGGVVQTWDGAGVGPVKVKNGDKFKVTLTTPFAMTTEVAIKRFAPDIRTKTNLAEIMGILRTYLPTLTDIKRVGTIIGEIAQGVPWLGLKQEVNLPINLKLLSDYFVDQGLAAQVLPNAATKAYTTNARPWAATGSFAFWQPVNPVTGGLIDFGYLLFSPVYGTESVPGNYKLDYYANLYIPKGTYRVFSQADDVFEMYLDGTQVANKSGRGETVVTVTESRYYAVKVSNINTPANTPSYWTFAMVDTTTGAVTIRPEPGVWKTQEYSAS